MIRAPAQRAIVRWLHTAALGYQALFSSASRIFRNFGNAINDHTSAIKNALKPTNIASAEMETIFQASVPRAFHQ